MITTNQQKKTLVDRLYRDNVITLDDVLVLLEEHDDVPVQSIPHILPINTQPSPFSTPLPPYENPYRLPNTSYFLGQDPITISGSIFCGTGTTCSYISSAGITTNIANEIPVGAIVSYTNN